MINVELSNIWSHVSLPDLLAVEKDLFDAHLLLRNNQPDGNDYLGWLGQPDAVIARMILSISKASEAIRASGDILVVIGTGNAFRAAKAAIDLMANDLHAEKQPQVIFAGDNFSSHQWLQLCESLNGHDFCMHLISPYGQSMESNIASRSMRWMMERRYGAEAKQRIFVSTMPQSPLATMAKEEGYTLLCMPEQLGACSSALTSASLLPMAVAGIDPLAVLEGAVQAWHAYDLRAFENPVWMYAGARHVLASRGFHSEILSTFDPQLKSFAAWWKSRMLRSTCQNGVGLFPIHADLTADLDDFDSMLLSGRYPLFQTLLRIDLGPTQKVNVEMDWKDYDNLGYLSGRTLADVAEQTYQALIESYAEADIPFVILECDQLDAAHLGELLYFFELASAICAAADGILPLDHASVSQTRELAQRLLGKQDA